jgi:hypothetical protein
MLTMLISSAPISEANETIPIIRRWTVILLVSEKLAITRVSFP